MDRMWVFLSVRGRLSPADFVRAFWTLFLIGFVATALMPTQRTVGYPLNHLAGFAYALLAAWPWLAITAKRLRDGGRPVALALPAALALPLAYAATLAADTGALGVSFYVTAAAALTIYAVWGVLMWHVYRLPRALAPNRFAPPDGQAADRAADPARDAA
jgi:uncharacterized membrane protein YhaH (DUF805 family)